MNMRRDMISSDGFYRNCLCVLEVEMECALELEDEIKFESIQGTCMMFVKNDRVANCKAELRTNLY